MFYTEYVSWASSSRDLNAVSDEFSSCQRYNSYGHTGLHNPIETLLMSPQNIAYY